MSDVIHFSRRDALRTGAAAAAGLMGAGSLPALAAPGGKKSPSSREVPTGAARPFFWLTNSFAA